MEEHPRHWRHTLMGYEFWRDAKQYEDKISQELDIALDLDLDLPKRFPFNLGPEETTAKRQRRLSSSDAGNTGLQRHASLSTGVSRFRAHERRKRSPSPRKMMAIAMNAFASRDTTPAMPCALRLGRSSPCKQPDLPLPPGVIIETREVSPSPTPPLSRQPSPPVDDFATAANPFIGFRGGSTWSEMLRTKKSLGLDLFWPYSEESDESLRLEVNELKPLCQFRSLRSLKITGMLHSYQFYIWQTAWLNLDLEELCLEMALEPKIDSAIHAAQWKLIGDGWGMDKKQDAEPVYYGNLGDGALHPDIGCGEYLDKNSIEKAKILAMVMGRTFKRLSIKRLTLSGFVVDADPFLLWFDAEKLESIKFKGHCIDAGFWLARTMEKVTVRYPRKTELEPVAVGMVSVDVQKDLKVVNMPDGWDVGESAFPAFDDNTRAIPLFT
ncbi:hypothetical protein F1880_001778 [Penicillium rolfsii]|nr:hypothetical protein F1880_001778 [Penicillium rolfsii]